MRTRTGPAVVPPAAEHQRRARLIGIYQAERVALVRLAHLMTGSPGDVDPALRRAPTVTSPPMAEP